MTLMSGQVINLPELYKANDLKCCISRDFLGDYTPIVNMKGSGGKFLVTNDPQCKDDSQTVPSAAYPTSYQAIWACGSCKGSNCNVDGGLQLALPDDWCVDSQNKQDPSLLCSTAAPLCDAGYSGKCVALPAQDTQPVSSGPSITLQSGLVVDLSELQQQYQGQCCLPRSVLNDYSAVLRVDNSDGSFFVSMDPSCSIPLSSDIYPAMFEYISVGCPASSSASGSIYIIDGGPTLVSHDATCDPYDLWAGACWGQSSICSFANTCIGIPSYGYDCWGDGWAYYRPRWWLPLHSPARPGWVAPPIVNRPGLIRPIRPPPPGWRPGQSLPGWNPAHRPAGLRPAAPLRPPGGKHWPSTRPAQPIHKGPGSLGPAPSARPAGRPSGPGQLLPSGPGSRGGGAAGQPSWVTRPAATLPTTRPSTATTQAHVPITRPNTPTTRPGTPMTRPSNPTARPTTPATRPSNPTTRPSTPAAGPSSPKARPSAPAARPSAPATRPSTPAARPNAPAARPSTPATIPYIPPNQPAGGGRGGGGRGVGGGGRGGGGRGGR